MRRFKLIVLFVFAGFAAGQIQAQTQADLTGTWKVAKVDVNQDMQSRDLVQEAEQLAPALATATIELAADGQCKFLTPGGDTQFTVENGKWRFDDKRKFILISRPDMPGWGTVVLRVLDGATPSDATLQILESAVKLNVKKS